jgi:hypothetical protein
MPRMHFAGTASQLLWTAMVMCAPSDHAYADSSATAAVNSSGVIAPAPYLAPPGVLPARPAVADSVTQICSDPARYPARAFNTPQLSAAQLTALFHSPMTNRELLRNVQILDTHDLLVQAAFLDNDVLLKFFGAKEITWEKTEPPTVGMVREAFRQQLSESPAFSIQEFGGGVSGPGTLSYVDQEKVRRSAPLFEHSIEFIPQQSGNEALPRSKGAHLFPDDRVILAIHIKQHERDL